MSESTIVGPEIEIPASPETALRTADQLAALIEGSSIERDARRSEPIEELELVSASGLLGISVPTARGGPGLSPGTVAEVFRRLARGDSAITQMLLAHFVLLDKLDQLPSGHPTAEAIFADVLAGAQIGNATAERGTKHGWEHRTRVVPDPDGGWRLDGLKYYATGSLGADWIAVAALRGEGHPVTAYIRPDADGVGLDLDDWSSFGQRSTFSGTVTLENVHVPDAMLDDRGPAPAREEIGPTVHGAYDQILHAAIDVGIARAALEDGAEFVRTRTRPWREAESGKAFEEPHIIRRVGELKVRLDALEAMLERAGHRIDAALAAPRLTDENTAAASLAVAGVKALAQELALEIANGIFELMGTSSTDEKHGMDRHWRNLRVHTLHDPARWKYVHIGNHYLNGVRPPRSELL